MPRIAKADVNKALQQAARSIVAAGGADGRVSRAELKQALGSLTKKEAALADIFFKFVDNRDWKRGAQVTSKDVTRAVEYAKKHMIAKYDLNTNGLSRDEVARMSLTGQRAVDLAKALKAAGASDDDTVRLSATKLGQEVGKFASKANYISESDYSPAYFTAAFPAGHDLNGHNVMTAMKATLSDFFELQGGDLSGLAAEVYGKRDATSFINGLSDSEDAASDAAFKSITTLLKGNLTDLQVVKIGPKDEDTGELATDQGLYAKVLIGRTVDGKVAGVLIGAVET